MKTLLIALSLLQASPSFDQPWTLQRCIDWALEHNLTVARSAAAVQSKEIDKNTADWSWAPSVSAQAGQTWNFGRGIGGDNTYEKGNSASTSFTLGAGMTLFDGLATPQRMKLAALNLEAATADLDKAREDVRVAVTRAYVQVLYNYEIRDVAREQLSIDSLQVARLEGMFDSGMASAADVSQQKASMAQSLLTLIQAQNNVTSALLDLSQLLELPSFQGFEVVRPAVEVEELYMGLPDDIYADALGLRPAIRAEQLRLEGTARSLSIAKAAYLPSLSLNAGLGTNYYTSFASQRFWNQLNSNFSQYVGLTLSVPIFNRMSTRNAVRSAQLQRRTQEIQLRLAQQELYKEIQQAWNGAVAARVKYDASSQAVLAARDAFDLTQAKYENGKATFTEFNESRNRLAKAQSECAQATYEYLFQTRLVEFYRGGELKL